jgi:hypothetical protein
MEDVLSNLGQGLTLSGYGILITFCALGILIGLILLLKALFPHRRDSPGSGEPLRETPGPHSSEREEILKKAAAAGVSVLIQKENLRSRGSLGKLLEYPLTEWWRKGVDRVQGKE